MEHFNQLTPAQLERLAILAEEMGEAIQIIGKIVRHGYFSSNPLIENSPCNRDVLAHELGHVRSAMIALCDSGDLIKKDIHRSADMKKISIKKWQHHQ